jgi:hypothetical protein
MRADDALGARQWIFNSAYSRAVLAPSPVGQAIGPAGSPPRRTLLACLPSSQGPPPNADLYRSTRAAPDTPGCRLSLRRGIWRW